MILLVKYSEKKHRHCFLKSSTIPNRFPAVYDNFSSQNASMYSLTITVDAQGYLEVHSIVLLANVTQSVQYISTKISYTFKIERNFTKTIGKWPFVLTGVGYILVIVISIGHSNL